MKIEFVDFKNYINDVNYYFSSIDSSFKVFLENFVLDTEFTLERGVYANKHSNFVLYQYFTERPDNQYGVYLNLKYLTKDFVSIYDDYGERLWLHIMEVFNGLLNTSFNMPEFTIMTNQLYMFYDHRIEYRSNPFTKEFVLVATNP